MIRIFRSPAIVLWGLLMIPGAGPAAAQPATSGPGEALYVGVLEIMADGSLYYVPAPSPVVQVRFAFKKDSQGWRPVQGEGSTGTARRTLPAAMTWHLALGGRERGVIETAAGPEAWRSGQDMYAQDVVDKDKAPRIQYSPQSRWRPMNIRPVLAVSASNVADPDGWNRYYRPTARESERAIREFRRVVPYRRQCDSPETMPIRNVEYRDDEILVTGVLRSRSGWIVVGQELTTTRLDCGFAEDESTWDYWFVLKPDGTAQALGTRMWPLKAADVDADGKSELVFLVKEAHGDGYELFHSDLSRSVKTWWSAP